MHAIPRLALIVALLTAAGAGTATADDTPWTVHAADGEFGADRDNYSYALDPGGRLADGLVVVNNGTTPLDLAVYAADAFTTSTGGLDLRTSDQKPTDVGAWVHPGKNHVTVQPGQSTDVPFTVSVPANATPGDHLGGIVTALTQNGTERRVGLRLQLRVGGDLKPNLSVEDLDVRYSGGDATLTYTVHNTGNAILAARQSASVSGPFGTWLTNAARIADSPPLLPGERWRVSVPVHDVTPAVRLTGTVTLVPLLTDAAGSTAPLSTVETTAHAWAIPWLVLLPLVALCGLVAFVARRRTRASAGPLSADRPVDRRENRPFGRLRGPSGRAAGASAVPSILRHDDPASRPSGARDPGARQR